MAKIAISLPDSVFQAIEKERKARGETRSEFLRRAAEAFLRRERERQLEEQYIRGYQQYPETAEEAAFAESTLAEVLADNPWEDETEE
jgi:metal-responsive CopG/Arc/MetJ family transcriptional regulator